LLHRLDHKKAEAVNALSDHLIGADGSIQRSALELIRYRVATVLLRVKRSSEQYQSMNSQMA
jgi:hypothetical protein